MEALAPIIAAIIGAAISGAVTWWHMKGSLSQQNSVLVAQLRSSGKETERLTSQLRSKQQELSSAQQQVNLKQQQVDCLSQFKKKYEDVRGKLESSLVVTDYVQPVILTGPRYVGKTSLLMQWHAPWNHSRLNSTQTHKASIVPIYDFKRNNIEPHFADPEILTAVHVHLKLRVHDFPGELGAQGSIVELASQETRLLRRSTGKDLGVVLICMFDAEETAKGLTQSTIEYYNGELFVSLRKFVAHGQVGIERLILVFNKYDLLAKRYGGEADEILLKNCLKTYASVIAPLRGICNAERVCEVFTILDRDDLAKNNRGAPIVLGEAARNFVAAMAGEKRLHEIIEQSATTHAAPMFS